MSQLREQYLFDYLLKVVLTEASHALRVPDHNIGTMCCTSDWNWK